MSFIPALVGQSRQGIGENHPITSSIHDLSQTNNSQTFPLCSFLVLPPQKTPGLCFHKVLWEGTDRSSSEEEEDGTSKEKYNALPSLNLWWWAEEACVSEDLSCCHLHSQQFCGHAQKSLNFLWGLFQKSWTADLSWGDEKRDFHRWFTCRWLISERMEILQDVYCWN